MKLTTKQLKQLIKQVIRESVSERDQERYGLDWRGFSQDDYDDDYDEMEADSPVIKIKKEREALHALEDVLEEADSNIPWDSLKDDYIRLFDRMLARGVNVEWVMSRTRA